MKSADDLTYLGRRGPFIYHLYVLVYPGAILPIRQHCSPRVQKIPHLSIKYRIHKIPRSSSSRAAGLGLPLIYCISQAREWGISKCHLPHKSTARRIEFKHRSKHHSKSNVEYSANSVQFNSISWSQAPNSRLKWIYDHDEH